MGLYSDHRGDVEKVAWCALGRERLCFYCGEELGDTGVYWSSNNRQAIVVFLHPACAQVLGTHLIKDAARWEKFSGNNVSPEGMVRI
ncbi:MAG: hypothetical protein Q7O66_09515 [Dehalococcoidia bacterium]|nr:hypothetical protein [Dehalococcoidia bacterium]